MRIFITGATGFIGRALVPVLLRERHTVAVWARSEARARGRLGAEVEIVEASGGPHALSSALGQCDAIINLAGEPIVGARWTDARRQLLRDSRVGFTRTLVRALAAAEPKPRVMVSGSAVGFYGDRGDEPLTETSSAGNDFLASLCDNWEEAARDAGVFGLRVVLLRTGVVLGRDGGALARMLPPFRLGLGGPIGSGRQYIPWIHLHDLVSIIATALTDARYDGPVNGVAPEPATSRQFAAALGRALRRPAFVPAPAAALRALLGESAAVLLASQRVEPAVLQRLGFRFAFPSLGSALADIVGGPSVAVGAVPEGPTGRGRGYELRTSTTVNAPIDETFAFFSRAENLGMLTPAAMRFSIKGRAPAIGEGTRVEYRMRVGPVPITWRSRIVNWMPGSGFVDLQEKGPYRSWWHEHSFRALGSSSTVVEDHVYYAPPLGPLGRMANRLFIVPALRRIFRYRADVIRLRFGTS